MVLTATEARAHIVKTAVDFNGDYNGDGYDCSNRFSADLGHPREAWCADFVSDVDRLAGYPLPVMQDGCHTGFAGVEVGYEYGVHHGARINSWESEPGDIVCFNWNSGGWHTERVVWWKDGVLRTIGGNSGASNVDGFKGTGGVHLHDWAVPHGEGMGEIKGVLNLGKLVDLGALHAPVPAKPKPAEHPRTLMLKSPHMHGDDVKELQRALNKLDVSGGPELKVDGVFGPEVHKAVKLAQRKYEDPLGVVAVHTRKFLKI